jgi:hypothetical protein
VGETSLVMRRNTKGGLGILTQGFDGRLDSGNGLAAVDSSGGDFCLMRNGLEHEEANAGEARRCGDTKMGSRLLLWGQVARRRSGGREGGGRQSDDVIPSIFIIEMGGESMGC